MKIRLNDEAGLRTQLPVVGFVTEADRTPTVWVSGLGEVSARPFGEGHRFEFHVMQSGKYNLQVRDADEVWSRQLEFSEQTFLSFGVEFGVFLALFAVFITGVILWTIKSMRSTRNIEDKA